MASSSSIGEDHMRDGFYYHTDMSFIDHGSSSSIMGSTLGHANEVGQGLGRHEFLHQGEFRSMMPLHIHQPSHLPPRPHHYLQHCPPMTMARPPESHRMGSIGGDSLDLMGNPISKGSDDGVPLLMPRPPQKEASSGRVAGSTGKGKYKRYSQDQLRWAVDYMRTNQVAAGKAAKAAEQFFGLNPDTLPKSTIWHYMHNPERDTGKRPGVATVLTDVEEAVLADTVSKAANRGCVLGKRAIKELATKMLENSGRHGHVKTTDGVLSNKWYKGFVTRHPKLRRRRGRSYTLPNISAATAEVLISIVEEATAEEAYRSEINVDTQQIIRGACMRCECLEYVSRGGVDSNRDDDVCQYCDHKSEAHCHLGPVSPGQGPSFPDLAAAEQMMI